MSIGTICFIFCFTVKVTPHARDTRDTHVYYSWRVQQMGCLHKKANLISLTNSETNLIALHVQEKGVRWKKIIKASA